MNSEHRAAIPRKIWEVLTPAERYGAAGLLALMFVGMTLETLGAGLVIPAIALLTQRDLASSYPVLRPALQALGNPSGQALIAGGMLALITVFFVKAVFLAFLTWRQTRFVY